MPLYMLCLHPDKLLKPFIISWFSSGLCRVLMYGIILPASHNASISFFCLSSLAFPLSSVSSFRVLVRMIDLLSVQLFSVLGRRVCESFSADFDPPRSSSSNAVHIFRALSQYQSVMFQHMTQLGFADSVLHRDARLLSHLGQGKSLEWSLVSLGWLPLLNTQRRRSPLVSAIAALVWPFPVCLACLFSWRLAYHIQLSTI